jgi:glycosyltransferase involved in cell wall biosynthesis
MISAATIAVAARGFDAVILNRDLVPEARESFLERFLLRCNPRVIFDFDDAIHIGTRNNKLRRLLPEFAWITPGNEYLASFARELSARVTVWPTVVDTENYRPVAQRRPGPIRVGWSGSDATARQCLPLLEGVLRRLARVVPFEFVVIAGGDPCLNWPGVVCRFLPWTPLTEVACIQEIDVGLMPLRDEPFERGKCGAKAIQYMGAAIPALVSPVGANAEIVQDEITGYHCRTEADWVRRLLQLIQDSALRHHLGEAAREHVVRRYSVQYMLPLIGEVLSQVSNG